MSQVNDLIYILYRLIKIYVEEAQLVKISKESQKREDSAQSWPAL